MTRNSTYGASWGTALKVMTAIACGILLTVMVTGLTTGPRGEIWWTLAMVASPLAMLVVAALFTIRGYTIQDNILLVHRVGWDSRVNLGELQHVEIDPSAMNKSLRTCGNGGMFCFAGAFWNKKLKHFRAFVSNPDNSVILRFPTRAVVVSPDDPQGFAEHVQAQSPGS